jgi:hypothetical protein
MVEISVDAHRKRPEPAADLASDEGEDVETVAAGL